MVALFTRAWIEIDTADCICVRGRVALFTRAWIEIILYNTKYLKHMVALFTRAWIEIVADEKESVKAGSRPLHEGVD